MTSTCIQPESHHVHITCLWAVFHVQRRKGGWWCCVSLAAERETTVQCAALTFRSMKTLDIFSEMSVQFPDAGQGKPRHGLF